MIKRAGCISFVCIFLFLCTTSNAQKWETQYINVIPIEDIENPVITCVYKDSYGFVWFGSLNGIYRWDGKNAKHYFQIASQKSTVTADQIISFLFEDEKTNLWFGGLGQGAIKYDRYSDKFSVQVFKGDAADIEEARWITRAFKDVEGVVWGIGITNNLFKYAEFNDTSSSIKLIIPDTLNNMSLYKEIFTMAHDFQYKSIWLGTSKGLVKYDIIDSRFEDFFAEFNHYIKNRPVSSLYMQNDSTLWIATVQAIYKYNLKTKKFAEYWKVATSSVATGIEQIEEILIRTGYENELWIFTNTGIYKLDIRNSNVIEYVVKNREHLFESSEFISARNGRFLDDNGFLWLATDNLGAGYANLNENPFEHIFIKDKNGEVISDGATSFYIDQHDDLWIGTGFNGLFHYDQDMNFIDHFVHSPTDPKSLTNDYVYSIIESENGTMWIGSNRGLNILDRKKKLFDHYIEKPIPYEGNLPHVRIADLFQDSSGTLWVGTSQGVYFSDIPNQSPSLFKQYDSITYFFNLTQQIFSDNYGDLWFVTPTYHGIYQLTKGIESAARLINYNVKNGENNFPTDGALCIAEDKDDIFWLGTKEGLYRWDRKTDNFKHFHKENGLGVNIVYWLCTDNRGYLWMSTESGLVRVKPVSTDKLVSKLFTYKDGIPFEKMYPYRFFKGSDNRIYIGGRSGSGDGFYRFYPDSIRENLAIPPVIVTEFKVFDKEYKLDSNIILNNEITLTHDNNFFAFEFAALDYTDPLRNQYAYKLEGLDEDWNYTGNRSYANYTGVQPGKYTFRVKGSNNDGLWNEDGSSIKLTILPPPWKKWWAYLLYGLALIVLLTSMFYYYFRRQQLLHDLQIKKVEADKLKEINSIRTRFFANISHEFRTPLTLILGPLNKMLEKATKDHEKKELSVVRRNALKLNKLINQLLELSKLEANKMQLHCMEINIVEWTRMCIQAFESFARQKMIDFTFKADQEKVNCFFDPEKMAQVLNNLIANAFKFTDEGEIKVEITSPFSPLEGGHRGVMLTISDTGRGIPKDKLQHIFERFYQADDSSSRKFEGTGIGLALAKELVELHHGTIGVESRENAGTSFTILLPLGKDHLEPDEIVTNSTGFDRFSRPEQDFTESEVSESNDSVNRENADNTVLLIVEDNADMRQYIRSFFEEDFFIIESVDGQEGFHTAIENVPDLIISDVMMPKMDGNELCQKIKADERTSHIPLILLTAKASKEDRIEGLETGADDFIIKPFDGEELRVRVKNLIEQHKRIRLKLESKIIKSHATANITFEDSGITSMDEQFLQKAVKAIRENYNNPEFNVEAFGKTIGLSRIQLHRKINALTNQTSSEFLRSYRLNRAAEMIKRKSATIAEIAYDVGFNSPSYFTECFRKHFGKTPSEFMQQ